MTSKEDISASKFLSLVLRHEPEAAVPPRFIGFPEGIRP